MGAIKRFTIGERVFAHLETWRIYSSIWSGMVSLVGACVALGNFPSLKIALLVFFIPFFGWVSGLYAMDYLDRKLDEIEKPQRPIPSGRIKPKEAIIFAFIFAALGFVLSFNFGIVNILLVLVVGFTVLSYTKFSKPRGLIANFNRGLVTLVTFYFGVFAINASISNYIVLLSIAFLIHDASTNIVGAMRDVGGDKKAGYLTTPARYGIKWAAIISLALTVTYLSLIIFVENYFQFMIYPYSFYALFLPAIVLLISLYLILFRSLKNISREKALMSHSLFVVERNTLACAFIFGITSSLSISVTIFLVTTILTVGLQILIRKRHEIKS